MNLVHTYVQEIEMTFLFLDVWMYYNETSGISHFNKYKKNKLKKWRRQKLGDNMFMSMKGIENISKFQFNVLELF